MENQMQLISITYDNNSPTVSGRELHEKLGIETPYAKWFGRMCEYGFEKENDYTEVMDKNVQNPQGGRPSTDHILTLDMAKQICMIQRTDTGRKFREYFLEIERKWNSPEAVIMRALQFANAQLDKLKSTVAIQTQQIAEFAPKASYYDVILNCKDLLSITKIAKDYGKSGMWLNDKLHELGIQFRQGDVWLLYQKYASQGYTSTKTHDYLGSDGENHAKVHTYWTQKGRLFIYNLLKQNEILPLIEQDLTEIA